MTREPDPAPLYPADPPEDPPGPLATLAGLVVGGLAVAGASWWAVKRFRWAPDDDRAVELFLERERP